MPSFASPVWVAMLLVFAIMFQLGSTFMRDGLIVSKSVRNTLRRSRRRDAVVLILLFVSLISTVMQVRPGP